MSVSGDMKVAPVERSQFWPRWFCSNIATAIATLVRRPKAKAVPYWRTFRFVVYAIPVASVLLVGLMAFVDGAAIEVARAAPAWLRGLAEVVSISGESDVFLVPLGVALVLIAALASPSLANATRLLMAATAVRCGFLFAAIAVPGLFTALAKRLIGRARPHSFVEIDPFLFSPFAWRPEYSSLPSGHATTAFAAAVAFGLLWPRLRPYLWTFAVAIALSRIVRTSHYPSDALVGAIVGGVGALLVRQWFAVRRLGFVVRPDGRMATLPGPSFARFKRLARRWIGR